MNIGDKGLCMLFPVTSNVLDVSKRRDINSGVYVYTESKGAPIVNYCERCNKSYYVILAVDNHSIMSTHVRVSRCNHSAGITPYLRSSNVHI
jgi:hypothetical protein